MATTTALRQPNIAPVPQTMPRVTPKTRTKNPAHYGWFVVMLLSAMVMLAFGTVYLYGHARVTAEGYRRVKLLAQLKQEQARSQRLHELNATAYTAETIDNDAKIIGLARPGDKDMVTAGETQK